MKIKRFAWFVFLLCCFANVSAATYRVEDVPMVHLHDSRRYVSNPDGILQPEAVACIDNLLARLQKATGIQVMVVAVEGIEGGDCFDFAYRLGEQNGVGEKGRDNGLVILLSTHERCIQFVTGYGLEGVLPDVLCKRIQDRYMLEHFRKNDWSTGMVAGVEKVCGVLDGSMKPGKTDDENWWLWAVAFLGLLASGSFLMAYRARRCPVCKKHKLRCVKEQQTARLNGMKVVMKTYRCQHCGHELVKQHMIDDDDFHQGGGPFVGGGFFGGFGGGGFSGGSFGGGSFGGGGSGSRF